MMESLRSPGMASEKGLTVIRFTCECGATLVATERRVGAMVKCPQCSKMVEVKAPDSQTMEPPTEIVTDDDYIRYYCICGKPLKNHNSLVGKWVKCPACDTVVTVPSYSTRRNSGDKFIRLICYCGMQMRVAHWHKGQEIKCPLCERILKVPNVDPGSTVNFKKQGESPSE